jgi:ParB-like chromosome segregation protein Spo0J
VKEFHPLADIFPMMEEDSEQFQGLVESIRANNGLRDAIVLHPDGRVLEGRHREWACEITKVEPLYEPYRGDLDDESLRQYVLDKNLHRRHLTPEQRRQFREDQIKTNPNKSDRALAEMLKCSHTTIAADRARLATGKNLPVAETPPPREGRDGRVRRMPRRPQSEIDAEKAAKKAREEQKAQAALRAAAYKKEIQKLAEELVAALPKDLTLRLCGLQSWFEFFSALDVAATERYPELCEDDTPEDDTPADDTPMDKAA